MPQVRKAGRDDLDAIVDWAAREGWNPGIEDADAFWAADPGGFWLMEDEGSTVAAISMVRYGETHAFLGFYMVRPDCRGKGFGLALWQAAMASVEGRIVGLDGVVAQQDNYRRSGFTYAHANIRHGGRVECATPSDPRLVSVAPVLMAGLAAYDAQLNPAPREAFLRQWLKETETRQSVALVRDGAITGYGTIRACREGFKIGPLFSDTDVGADLLFRALVGAVGGGEIYLDVPEPNAAARALCVRYNLRPVFETARMYRGGDPGLPLGRIFGITTFELG